MTDPLGQALSLLMDLERSGRLASGDAAEIRGLVLAARERHRAALYVAAAAQALCLAVDHAHAADGQALAGDPSLQEARQAMTAALAGLRDA